MDLIVRMVEHHVWLVGEMLDRATRLTDDQLDQQIAISVDDVDESPTLRWLLSRLVGQMHMWNNVMRDKDYDFALEEHESVGSMKQRFATVGPDFLAEVRQIVADGRLDDTFIDAHCTPVEVYTYGGMIAHVLNFAAFRRTLVLGAFASAGITTWVMAIRANGSQKRPDLARSHEGGEIGDSGINRIPDRRLRLFAAFPMELAHDELVRLSVAFAVEPPDQLVVADDGQHEVAELAFSDRLVHLELVAEAEQPRGAVAVVDQRVERRQQGGPRRLGLRRQCGWQRERVDFASSRSASLTALSRPSATSRANMALASGIDKP